VPLAAPPDAPLARRLGTLALGIACVAVGVALMIRAEVGVAPYDVLSTGVADTFDIAIGAAAMIVPVVFVGLAALLGARLAVGTVVSTASVGPVLGLVLDRIPEVQAMAPRVAMFVIGSLVVATGITAVVVAEIGAGPAELLMLAIHDRGHELARTRTAIELSAVAAGWALGGQVGVGTAVFALSIGFVLRALLRLAGYRADAVDVAALAAEPGA
jgi:uncharacterized membrane protein YczE